VAEVSTEAVVLGIPMCLSAAGGVLLAEVLAREVVAAKAMTRYSLDC